MKNSVVGVYDSYSQAQSAMNELIACGFDRATVHLHPGEERAAGTATTDNAGTSTSGGIVHFFRSLFGMDDNDSNSKSSRDHEVYAEAVRRGSYVLAIDADSEEQRDRAVDVMNRYDPVDIEERSAHWRSSGWTGYDASAPMLTDDEIARERSRYGDLGTAPHGAGLTEGSGVTPESQMTSSADERAASDGDMATPKERSMAQPGAPVMSSERMEDAGMMDAGRSTGASMTSDDSDFRQHWQTAYGQSGGRYEDYDAAYRYGSNLSGSDHYKNYRWDEVEPNARSEWESQHPDSAWERVKDAVRYGAERVSGNNRRS